MDSWAAAKRYRHAPVVLWVPGGRDHVGFVAETENYRFCLRCTTDRSDYSYIYCYDLNQQRLAMGEQKPGESMAMGGIS